jgi:CheY-like chemotaxis protein
MKPLADKKIMVLEDEAIVAMMIEDMLGELGAQVVGPASTVDEALRIIELHRFDAALLDIQVLGGTSEAVAQSLSERNVPFVFASGYSAHPSPRFPNAILLQKPYRIDALETALVAACGAAQSITHRQDAG